MSVWNEVGRTVLAAFVPILGAIGIYGVLRAVQVFGRKRRRLPRRKCLAMTTEKCREYIEGRYES